MTANDQLLATYLRNHEAAGHAGLDLFRRVTAGQANTPYVDELRRLTTDVHEDLRSLQDHMVEVRVKPDLVLTAALRLGERVGRLKPNGRIVRRSPLTDLVEIEALLAAVWAKASAWKALATLGSDAHGEPMQFDLLLDRARDQIDRLERIHRSVAAEVLAGS